MGCSLSYVLTCDQNVGRLNVGSIDGECCLSSMSSQLAEAVRRRAAVTTLWQMVVSVGIDETLRNVDQELFWAAGYIRKVMHNIEEAGFC